MARRDADLNLGESKWISLMDYAVKNDVSLSTLRRYIKANKVTHKIINGRYFLLDDALNENTSTPSAPAEGVAQLKADLQRAHEEIAELKMLVALYEERPAERLDV